MAAALLLLAAAGLAVALVSLDTDVDITAQPRSELATVVGRLSSCGPSCRSVVVRLDGRAPGDTTELRLPTGTGVAIGSRVSVRPDDRDPGAVRLVAQAERVDLSGLLGEAAIAAALTGLAIALIARRDDVAGTLPARP